MPSEIVAIDKDDTLCPEYEEIFPEAADFLQRQRARGRKCVVATNAVEAHRSNLRPVTHLLDGYYGREKIEGTMQYRKPDGSFGYIPDDYVDERGNDIRDFERMKLALSPTRQWPPLLHRADGTPFYFMDRYVNPHNDGFNFPKDVHLLRRLVAERVEEVDDLKMVLVGDSVDLANAAGSDPATPLIMVDGKGKWMHRKNTNMLLEFLLRSRGSPADVFDETNAAGRPVDLPLHKSVVDTLSGGDAAAILGFIRQRLAYVWGAKFIFLTGYSHCSTRHVRAIVEDTHTAVTHARQSR